MAFKEMIKLLNSQDIGVSSASLRRTGFLSSLPILQLDKKSYERFQTKRADFWDGSLLSLYPMKCRIRMAL